MTTPTPSADLVAAARASFPREWSADAPEYPPPLDPPLLPWWIYDHDFGHSVMVLHPEHDPGATPEQWVESDVILLPVAMLLMQEWSVNDAGFITVADATIPADLSADRTMNYLAPWRYTCDVCQERMDPGQVHGGDLLRTHPTCQKPEDWAALVKRQDHAPGVVVTPTRWFAGFAGSGDHEGFKHVGEVAEFVIEHGYSTCMDPKKTDAAKSRKNVKQPVVVGGQAWITADLLQEWGVDVAGVLEENPGAQAKRLEEFTAGLPFLEDAKAAGWELRTSDEFDATTASKVFVVGRKTGDTYQQVRVVLVPFVDGIAADLDSDPAAIARRLAVFSQAVGFPWLGQGGWTGLGLLEALHRQGEYADDYLPGSQPQRFTVMHRADVAVESPYRSSDSDEPTRISPLGGCLENKFIDWHRPLTEEESRRRYLHGYDRNAAYLGLIGGQQYPTGKPVLWERPTFDKGQLGLWQVELPPLTDTRLPHPLRPVGGHFDSAREGELVWVTTTTLELAMLDDAPWRMEPTIHQAIIWPKNVAAFKEWQSRLSNPRRSLPQQHHPAGLPLDATWEADMEAVLEMTKGCYKVAIGMIGRRDDKTTAGTKEPWYVNRNWHHFIMSTARKGMLLAVKDMMAANVAPVGITNDSLYLVSDEPDPIKAWPVRNTNGLPKKLHRFRTGQFKEEETWQLTPELVAAFADPKVGIKTRAKNVKTEGE